MIGIYRFYNKTNKKSYVGLSNNISRRKREHLIKPTSTSKIPFDDILQKNKENFVFEVLEECRIDQLEEREIYWIKYYNSYSDGYNMTEGGDRHSSGENNGRAILTEEDVRKIRGYYNSRERTFKSVVEEFPKVTENTLRDVWQGLTWSHIMPEVLTEENKIYYSREATLGEKSSKSILTDDEVLRIRERYVNETAREIYKDFEGVIAFQTLQQLLWGRRYKHLPIYKKKDKKWVHPK